MALNLENKKYIVFALICLSYCVKAYYIFSINIYWIPCVNNSKPLIIILMQATVSILRYICDAVGTFIKCQKSRNIIVINNHWFQNENFLLLQNFIFKITEKFKMVSIKMIKWYQWYFYIHQVNVILYYDWHTFPYSVHL